MWRRVGVITLIALFLTGGIISMVMGKTIGQWMAAAMSDYYHSKSEATVKNRLKAELQKVAVMLSRDLPKAANADLILQSVEANDLILIQQYRVNRKKADMDKLAIDVFHKQAWKALVQATCSDIELMRRGVSYRFLYEDVDGLQVADILIDASDCARAASSQG